MLNVLYFQTSISALISVLTDQCILSLIQANSGQSALVDYDGVSFFGQEFLYGISN